MLYNNNNSNPHAKNLNYLKRFNYRNGSPKYQFHISLKIKINVSIFYQLSHHHLNGVCFQYANKQVSQKYPVHNFFYLVRMKSRTGREFHFLVTPLKTGSDKLERITSTKSMSTYIKLRFITINGLNEI